MRLSRTNTAPSVSWPIGDGRPDIDTRKIDPAALLIAVFAAVAPPLIQEGAWGYPTTIVCAVVLSVLILFSWFKERPARAPWWPRALWLDSWQGSVSRGRFSRS
jgi:hypothetical protein